MDSIELRSHRDPAFWVPLLLSVLVLACLIFVAYGWASDWLDRLRELASSDPEAARDEAVRILRVSAWSFCAVMAAFCAYLFRYFQLGRREGRLPPSGWWSLGALRAIVGRKARRTTQFGFALLGLLLAAAIWLGLSVERLIRLLEAGMLAAQ